jgi:hypothetical protein
MKVPAKLVAVPSDDGHQPRHTLRLIQGNGLVRVWSCRIYGRRSITYLKCRGNKIKGEGGLETRTWTRKVPLERFFGPHILQVHLQAIHNQLTCMFGNRTVTHCSSMRALAPQYSASSTTAFLVALNNVVALTPPIQTKVSVFLNGPSFDDSGSGTTPGCD